MKNEDMMRHLLESIEGAESALKAAHKWTGKLSRSTGIPLGISQLKAEASQTVYPGAERIIEGVFDGQNMTDGQGQSYPVPANYASKSKLVEGDSLKLTIADDGAFIYKQIALVPRTLIVGHLVLDGSQYQVLVNNRVYKVLYASVSFYQAKVGDRVTIIVPENKEAKFAAIENIIPKEHLELAEAV